MKRHYVVALAVLAGFALGAIVVHGVHAQAKPPVYLIEEIQINNPDAFFKEFAPKIGAINKAAGVRALAAGGKTISLEGEPPKTRTVIQVWDSVEAFNAFRNTAEFKEAKKIGEKYATYRAFLIEGGAQYAGTPGK